MRLMVNGEAWMLHVRHANVGYTKRFTQAWLHLGPCVLVDYDDGSFRRCTIETHDAALFIFPTNVLRRRAAFVHGNPVIIKERWSMPFSRAVGRKEALARLLLTMFPSRGPGDDKTSRAAFWAAYFTARTGGK